MRLCQTHLIIPPEFSSVYCFSPWLPRSDLRTTDAAASAGKGIPVELASYHIRVVLKLSDLHQHPNQVRCLEMPCRHFQILRVIIVELPSMAVALLHLFLTITVAVFVPAGAHMGYRPRTHGSTHVCDGTLFKHQVDYRIGCTRSNSVELASSCPRTLRANSTHITCIPRHRPR